ERRADWIAEWTSELWYVLRECDGRRALLFCLGAFQDALWLRRNQFVPAAHTHPLQSPLRCLSLLATTAAVAIALFLRAPGPLDAVLRREKPWLLFAHLFMVAVGFLVMSATTSLSLGEYPVSRSSPARARRFQRWVFLGTKFILVTAIVFCGTFDLATVLS